MYIIVHWIFKCLFRRFITYHHKSEKKFQKTNISLWHSLLVFLSFRTGTLPAEGPLPLGP